MQNWEKLQKVISKMNKKEFIDFICSADRGAIHRYADLCDTKKSCSGTNCSERRCVDCVIDLLEEEYQPTKQEKWVVHRTLRKRNREVYIGIKNPDFTTLRLRVFDGIVPTTYEKEYSFKYDFHNAVMLRDELNKYRVGKQYLWVISKVEE